VSTLPQPILDLRAALFAETGTSSEAIDREGGLDEFAQAVGALATEDFFCVMDGGALTTRYEGIEGLRAGWMDFMGAFETIVIEPGEVTRIGDSVLEFVRLRGKPKGIDGEVQQDAAAVWRLRGDQLEGVEFHLDRARARASAEAGP
jgi:hypothetical protein